MASDIPRLPPVTEAGATESYEPYEPETLEPDIEAPPIQDLTAGGPADFAGESAEAGQARRSKAVALMASGTLISRVLGFVRTALLAVAIGTTTYVGDIFEKANTVPTIIFMLLAGGIFNVILVPQLIKAARASDRGSSYTSKLMTLTIVVMAGLSALLTLASPFIIRALSTDWTPPMLALGTVFTYWCMPQVFFYGVYAVAGQVLNAHERFGAYMWAPVANNVLQLLALGLYIVMFGSYAGSAQDQLSGWSTSQTVVLAGGATLGIVMQAVVLFWPLRRLGLGLHPDFGWRGIGLRKVGKMAAWTLAAMAVGNLTSLYFGKLVSAATQARESLGTAGAAVPGEAALNQSQLVTVLPHSIFAVSIATVLFNQLSRAFADDERSKVPALVSQGLRTTAVPVMFFTVGFIVLAGPLGRLFGGTSVQAIAAGSATGTLIVLTALGLPGKTYAFFLMRVFYAQEDTRTPMLLQVAYALCGLACAFVVSRFISPLIIAPAVAIIYATSNTVQAIVAHIMVKRRFGDYGAAATMAAYIRLGWLAVIAGAAGGLVLLPLGGFSHGWAFSGYGPALLSLAASGIAMALVYLLLLGLTRSPEAVSFLGPVARRIPGMRSR